MAMQDLYIRSENDPKFKKGVFSTSDEDEILFNNFKMCVETPKYAVLGSPDFGVDEASFLFSKKKDLKNISRYIFKKITDFSRLSKSKNISVQSNVITNNGTEDIVLVDVSVEGKTIYGYGFY